MGKSLIINNSDFSENGIDTNSVNWLTNYALLSLPTNANRAGYGWAGYEDGQPIGRRVTHVRFKTSLSSGFIELGIAPSLGCLVDDITQVQRIDFTEENKEGVLVVLKLNEPILLTSGQFIVIYPLTKPDENSFMYGSSGGYGFYTDVPVSRRGTEPWKRTYDDYNIGFDFGFID